jgi:Uma2 family endonuclease
MRNQMDAHRTAATLSIGSRTGEASVRPLRRSEFEVLTEHGAFGDEKIELLRGSLVHMSPQGLAHANIIMRLTSVLVSKLYPRYDVRPQLPFAADDTSMPEPDLAIVPTTSSLLAAHPSSALLIIEASMSSLWLDRGLKAEIYSQSGVPEYWVIDIAKRLVVVHRGPGPDGYGHIEEHGDEATLTALLVPLTIDVAQMVPSRMESANDSY